MAAATGVQGHGRLVVDEHDVRVTSVFTHSHEHAVLDEYATSDEKALGALGYKQEFKRDFSLLESFAVSFSVLGLLPSVASTITYSLGYAGTGGAVWGWLIAALMIQCTALSMAELCSSMPTAGGLYYAAAALAPEGWGPLCSWIVGWSNMAGYAIGPCSINYATAAMLVTCGQIAYPNYVPQDWHIYLILVGLCVTQGLVAMQSTKFIGWVNVVGTVWNVVIVLIFIIWFPVGSVNTPKTNDNSVWTTFENGTEWPIGWAVIMGFLTTCYTLAGYDTPFHLSEECSNANIASPRAIVMTAQLGLYLGWAIILVIAYTVKDVGSVVNSAYGQPFGSLCVQVLGRRAGLAMFALNIPAQYFVGQGVTITATRVVFAYSRDGAIVGSRWWGRVHPRTKTPVYATWGVISVSILVGLLLFGGPITINAVFTMVVIGQYTAFTAPVALKLLFGRGRFRPGPWNLGRWSAPINAVAVAWWLLIVPALVFPAVKGKDLTPKTMNWTSLIYGGVMLLALLYYAFSARKWFKGPRVNVAHVAGLTSDAQSSEDVGVHPEKRQA